MILNSISKKLKFIRINTMSKSHYYQISRKLNKIYKKIRIVLRRRKKKLRRKIKRKHPKMLLKFRAKEMPKGKTRIKKMMIEENNNHKRILRNK